MFGVFIDRPYYPSMEALFKSEAEALVFANDLARDFVSEDGDHDCTIYVARVIKTIPFKSDY